MPPTTPVAVHTLDVDRLASYVLRQLQAAAEVAQLGRHEAAREAAQDDDTDLPRPALPASRPA
jgi:hypothetical protein